MSSREIRKAGPLMWQPSLDVGSSSATGSSSLLSYIAGHNPTREWTSVMCVVTRDHQLCVLKEDSDERTSRPVLVQSLWLEQCSVHIQHDDTTDRPIFQIIERTTRTEDEISMWSFLSFQEQNDSPSRSHRFQCPDQSTMMDWIFALRV